jgi:UDP-2,4-diacetamido-2,4,6-trideoxy-beta-L-altropyranose hydrolase
MMTLLIRADGSAQIGTGHLMRMLALAQAWQPRGHVHFLSAEITPALAARLAVEEFAAYPLAAVPGSAEDAAATIASAREHGAAWAVVDGYQFGADYQRRLKDAGLRVLLLDDYGHAGDYCADLVLNQNLSADAALYTRRAPHTRLLLGTRYALLRREFLAWRDWKREIPAVARKVLVTLGGADPDNVTGKVIEALRGLDVEAKIVVGGSNPHLESLRSSISNLPSPVRLAVDAPNMPELMAWADVAVAAAGSTSWELAFMGLPAVVMVLAENQVGIAASLEREGLSVNLGAHKGVTIEKITSALQSLFAYPPRRRAMSRRGRAMVDGLGGERVSNRLAEYETESTTSFSSSGKQYSVLTPHSNAFKS